jgi:hypothetical protein
MFGTTSTPLPSCVPAKGIEYQSVGKYIVGVGSLHKSGKRYYWHAACHPKETELKAPPAWLVKLITEGKPKPQAKRTPAEQTSFVNALFDPATNGDRHKKYGRDLGHLLGAYRARTLDRRLLICLYDSHVERTWDLTDFGEEERIKIAQHLLDKEDAQL